MCEVGGVVPISGGDDETVKIDVRTKRLGGWCNGASSKAPSISPCHIIVDEKKAGEVDPDVKIEV
jgi:hypothetical protein